MPDVCEESTSARIFVVDSQDSSRDAKIVLDLEPSRDRWDPGKFRDAHATCVTFSDRSPTRDSSRISCARCRTSFLFSRFPALSSSSLRAIVVSRYPPTHHGDSPSVRSARRAH